MPLEQAVCLVIWVKNMPVRIEESGHVLVCDGEGQIISLQPSNYSNNNLSTNHLEN